MSIGSTSVSLLELKGSREFYRLGINMSCELALGFAEVIYSLYLFPGRKQQT